MNDLTQPPQASLSPQTLFAVLSRAIGLSYFAGALSNLWSGLFIEGMFRGLLRDSVGNVAIGCFLIFGAGMLQRLLYPVDVPSPRT